MAKAASPIRLQADIMQAATLAGKRHHRSTAEQIEYWAEMGRKIGAYLNPDDLLSVSSGLANIKIEPILSGPVNADEIFQALEEDRAHGSLPQTVTGSAVKYQASLAHPGYLERIGRNGDCAVGKFEGGEFIVITQTAP